MRAHGHRRQVLLFLAAVFVPCLLLVILSVRMMTQEPVLAEKRRQDRRVRLLAEIRRDLLGRLERIKFSEMTALAKSVRRSAYLHPAVVFVAQVEDDRPVFPWEGNHYAERFRKLLGQSEVAKQVHEGEQHEFAAGELDQAIRSYTNALRLARTGSQAAYVRMFLARALDKAGRRAEALGQFRRLLDVPPEVTDEEGIPVSLDAAERMVQAGVEHAIALKHLEWAAAAAPALPPAAYYLASGLAEKLSRSADADVQREAARQAHSRIAARIRDMEQAVALQRDFPRLHALRASGKPLWMAYGEEEPWLVSTAAAPAGGVRLIALRASQILPAVQAAWSRPGAEVRLGADADVTGESLGAELNGIKAILLLADDGAPGSAMLQRLAYIALIAVLSAMIFGAYLLWRDFQREFRMAELQSQFVASVSHELKTPLTAIRMFAETMQMGRARDPVVESEYLETIVNECERLSRLVDDVLHFSKIEQGKKLYHFCPVSLAEVVDAACRAMQYPLQGSGFDLRVNADEDLPPLMADRDALEQALLNLLSNAVKYSGDSRLIELELKRDGDCAVVSVTDHGVGIAPEEQERVFEKFYRSPTRENQLVPGTGLGLALVAHIVKAHGGRVAVDSAPGRGSTFSMYFPLENPHEHDSRS